MKTKIQRDFDSISNNRIELAAMPQEHLNELPVKALLTLLRGCGITRSEDETPLGKLKRPELLTLANRVAEDARRTENISDPQRIAAELSDISNERIAQLYEVCAQKVSEDTCDPGAVALWLVSTVNGMKYTDNRGVRQSYSPTTVNRFVRGIGIRLERATRSKREISPVEYQRAAAMLSDIRNLTRHIEEQRVQYQSVRGDVEAEAVVTVRVERLYAWARLVLDGIDTGNDSPEYVSEHWLNATVSLLVLTGRRTGEIFTEGCELSNPGVHTLTLHGQLKRRGSMAVDNQPYPFHALGSPEKCLNLYRWLRRNGKVSPTPEKAHNRFSRPVNERADRVIEQRVEVVEDPGQLFKTHYTKAHIFRALYALKVIEEFCPSNMAPNHFAKRQLGETSVGAVDSYLRKLRLAH